MNPDTGTLWLKDGSASKTLEIIPRNCLFCTDDELELIRQGIGSCLNQLPEGALVQLLLLRERSTSHSDHAFQIWKSRHTSPDDPPSSRGEQLLKAKEELCDSFFGDGLRLQTRIFVTLRLDPAGMPKPGGKMGPLAHLAFGRSQTKKTKSSDEIEHDLSQAIEALRSGLTAAGFELSELTSEEKIQVIFRFLNPDRPEVPPTPEQGSAFQDPSDWVASSDLSESRWGLRLGRTSVGIGTLKAFPETSFPCLLAPIAAFSQPFALTMTLLVLPQTSERERLSRRQRLAHGMASGNTVRNLVAESQLTDIEDTLSAMISSGDKLLAASFHFLSFGEDSIASILREAEKVSGGCQWFEETAGAFPVFFGILPFAPTFVTRPLRILGGHLSDLAPTFGIGSGHEGAEILLETPYQSLFGFSLFEKTPSANSILIGSTGSGKSTLACGIILGMAAGNNADQSSSFVIDVGNSFKRTIQYLGGASLDLSPENGTVVNPFDLGAGQTAPDPEKVKFLTSLFEEILGDDGRLGKLEKALLEDEVIDFYRSERPKDLSGFKLHLESSQQPELARLSKLLSLWCRPHPYGLLLDGPTNVKLDAEHLHFELKGCQRYPDLLRVAMLVVMDSIWREVKGRFPKRSLIVIDECHTMIRSSGDGRSNPSARWIEDCFRQMRKFSSAAIAISQTARDLKNPEIGDGILANAPNRFILRQRGDERALREDLKLNDREAKEVFTLNQVRGAYSEFFLQSESVRGTFAYRPSPLELWLSTTHPPDIELLGNERNKYPDFDLPTLMSHMATHFPNGAEGKVA